MLFVNVHCQDEIDRMELIPLNRVARVFVNADGSDTILAIDGKAYIPREQDNFYLSIIDIPGAKEVIEGSENEKNNKHCDGDSNSVRAGGM